MSLLDAIQTDENVIESEERVASGSKRIDTAGTYDAIIKMANLFETKNGAIGFKLQLETEDGSRLTHTEYITNVEKKSYYINKEGQKVELPGYSKVCALNYLLTGVFSLPKFEEREIKEYDYELQKEVPVKREVAIELINRVIGICVTVTLEDGYKDKTKETKRVEVAHFYDPVTKLFASEKKANKPAEMLEKFKEAIERTPIKDKRKESKGSSTEASNSQENISTRDVGF